MKLKEKLFEIENIEVGFDVSLAEKKLNLLDSLLREIENLAFADVCTIQREDLILLLKYCYGISYEIGNTKQSLLNPSKEIEIAQRALLIARFLFGKSEELLPFLSLCYLNAFDNKSLQDSINMEIEEIKTLNIK